MANAFPEVIPRTRTVNIGGEAYGSERFSVELQTQSLADVRALIRNITAEETATQVRLGNPPAVIEVDDRTGKDIDDVQRKAVVIFGTQLAVAAMRAVEIELAAAIAASTVTHTGRLRATSSAWRWLFVPKGGAARPVNASGDFLTFSAGDMLLLVPQDVPYATITNRNVARSGKLQQKVRGRGHNKVARGSMQNVGFLSTATRAVKRRAEFKQFVVMTDFTRAHMVPGEVMTRTQGTGYIKIRPRFRR